jgi:hypothetical protein
VIVQPTTEQVEAFARRPMGGRLNRGRFGRRAASSNPFTILGATNVVAWWRSDLGITLNGGNVSAWADQSGNGHNLAQGTAGLQPAYDATGGPNGRPKLDFTGDILVNSTLNLPAPGTTPVFFWLVVSQIDFSVNARLFGTGVNMAGMTQSSSGNVNHYNQTAANVTAFALATFKRAESYFSNSTSDYNKVGSATTTGTNAGNSDPSAQLVLGGFDAGGGPVVSANIRCCEFFITNALPSGAQITALDAYATSLYGASMVS